MVLIITRINQYILVILPLSVFILVLLLVSFISFCYRNVSFWLSYFTDSFVLHCVFINVYRRID